MATATATATTFNAELVAASVLKGKTFSGTPEQLAAVTNALKAQGRYAERSTLPADATPGPLARCVALRPTEILVSRRSGNAYARTNAACQDAAGKQFKANILTPEGTAYGRGDSIPAYVEESDSTEYPLALRHGVPA